MTKCCHLWWRAPTWNVSRTQVGPGESQHMGSFQTGELWIHHHPRNSPHMPLSALLYSLFTGFITTWLTPSSRWCTERRVFWHVWVNNVNTRSICLYWYHRGFNFHIKMINLKMCCRVCKNWYLSIFVICVLRTCHSIMDNKLVIFCQHRDGYS